jgi:hypothetical protein
VEHGRGDKIIVFKYKNKTRYRRRQGHRQDYTRLAIRQIVTEAGQVVAAAAKPARPARRSKKEPDAGEETPTAAAAGATAAPAAKRTTRKAPVRKTRAKAEAEAEAAEAAAEAVTEAAEASAEVAEGIEAAAGPAGDEADLGTTTPPPLKTRIKRTAPKAETKPARPRTPRARKPKEE